MCLRSILRLALGLILSAIGLSTSLNAAPVVVIPGTVAIHLYFPASVASMGTDATGRAARCGNQVANGWILRQDCVGR